MIGRCPFATRLLLLCALSFAGTMSASAQNTYSPADAGDGQFGFHLFQLLLEQQGLRSITEFEDAVNGEPDETVLILAGDLSWMNTGHWSSVLRFVRSGGAILIATDKRTYAPDLFLIKEGPLTVSNPDDAYQGFQDCPVVDDLSGTHPLNENVTQVIGNRSGWISRRTGRHGRWSAVAFLPRFERGNLIVSNAPLIAELTPHNSRRGRLLVASDHSLFINGMLWHGSNAMLAINTADWLCQDRRRTLHFNISGVASRSGIPIPPIDGIPEIPPEDMPPFSLEDLANTPPESMITFANSLIRGLEDENVFNQFLANHASEMPRPEYLRQVYLTLAFLAGFWVIRQLLRRGRRFEPPATRSVVPASSTRVQDLLNSKDLQRPLRELARDLFRTLTGSDDPRDWSVAQSAGRVSGLSRLEKIATNVDRRPVPPREFKRLVKKIDRIRQLHEQGQLATS